MEEKLDSTVIRTGLITMAGEIKSSKTDAEFSDLINDFMSGVINFMAGHSESWLTDIAKSILNSLKEKGLIVLTSLDEFQMNLKEHWGDDFRYLAKLSSLNQYQNLSFVYFQKNTKYYIVKYMQSIIYQD